MSLIRILKENANIEPYYNKDFINKFKQFLSSLSYEDIEVDTDAIYFHNPDYDNKLTNKDAPKILDFIESYGYEPDDFIVRGSVIMFPTNF